MTVVAKPLRSKSAPVPGRNIKGKLPRTRQSFAVESSDDEVEAVILGHRRPRYSTRNAEVPRRSPRHPRTLEIHGTTADETTPLSSPLSSPPRTLRSHSRSTAVSDSSSPDTSHARGRPKRRVPLGVHWGRTVSNDDTSAEHGYGFVLETSRGRKRVAPDDSGSSPDTPRSIKRAKGKERADTRGWLDEIPRKYRSGTADAV